MQAILKTLVIGMGVLIVLGLGLLVYGFYKTSHDPGWRLFGPRETPPAAGGASRQQTEAPILAGDVALGLPPGCAVTDLRLAGGLIYVLTGPRRDSAPAAQETACGQVLVIDPAAGRVTGRLLP